MNLSAAPIANRGCEFLQQPSVLGNRIGCGVIGGQIGEEVVGDEAEGVLRRGFGRELVELLFQARVSPGLDQLFCFLPPFACFRERELGVCPKR